MPRTEKQNKEIREKTRDKILQSALKLFADKGYNGTSIENISANAGISKGLAYNYFKSKEKIAEAILNKANEENAYLVNELKKVNEPKEQLKLLIEMMFNYVRENEQFWRLYLHLSLQPEVIEAAKEISKQFAGDFIIVVKTIFKKIGYKNPEAEARTLAAIIDGLGLQLFFDKENFPFNKMKKHVLKKYDLL